MKQARAFLLAMGLISALASPASAQTAPQPEPWRAHVSAFTAKLYGPVTDTHNQRNYFWAKKLAAIDHVTLDDDVIFAAAYLHDVGSMEGWQVKGQEHGDTSAAKLDQMLAGTDFPKDKMERVREAMRTHMFYREAGPSPEARYLHDADALDNVGTVGLAMLLVYVDDKGGGLTSKKAIEILTKEAPKIEQGAVTPAGKAEMQTRIAERKTFLDQLARETDDFKAF
jgi:HD superfamily phosphodiesterase